MALTPITEGNTSNPSDLNQIVNLLNGTDTATQVTLRGGFSSALAGQQARFIGGATAVDRAGYTGTPVEPSDGAYRLRQGDLAVLPGGPFAIGSGDAGIGFLQGVTNIPPTTWNPVGSGGYVARMHLSGTVNATAANQFIPMDTIDFDPRGMVQPFTGNGGGLAITCPNNGAFAFVGAIRGKGVNSANCAFWLSWFNPATGSIGSSVLCTTTTLTSAGSATDYTGGSAAYVIYGSAGQQLVFTTAASPRTSFQVDNTDSSRTYIAAWMAN